MRTLALDVAGEATGWALGEDRQLLDWGKFLSKVSRSRGQRLYDFAIWLEELYTEHDPDVVLIEKPFLGRNSNVLASLSRFIGVAEMQAYSILDLAIKKEWFLDPKEVKKLLKVRKPKRDKNKKAKHDENKKIMVARINELYGMKLQYDSKKNKKYNDDDIADSIALLHSWWMMQSKENA